MGEQIYTPPAAAPLTVVEGSDAIPKRISRRAAAGRGSKFWAKMPHNGEHFSGKKLDNVEEDLRKFWGRPPMFRTSLFCEIPAKFHENLQFFRQNLAKILQNFAKFQQNFWQKFEIGMRCKGVYCVDLGESFQMSIYYYLLVVVVVSITK